MGGLQELKSIDIEIEIRVSILFSLKLLIILKRVILFDIQFFYPIN